MIFNNAKKWFITPKTKLSVLDCLKQHLPHSYHPELVIQAGGVWKNRQRLLASAQQIEANETLIVYTSPIQYRCYQFLESQIIFQDTDIFVVFKPAGISATADRSSLTDNITAGVQAYFKSIGLNYQTTAINRLDFMVQGLMIFAKNKTSERRLFIAMQNRKIFKSYRAYLPYKENLPNCLRIKDRLSFKGRALADLNGKKAHSLFIKQSHTDMLVIYTVILLTGRRHQIRYHAAHYLAPLIHDSLYGIEKNKCHAAIGLIAYGLNFRLGKKRYRLRLPEQMINQF